MIKQNQDGLTLIEMLVVLSILTLMVGLVVPLIDNFRAYDGVRQQKKQLEELNQAAMAWARDYVLKYGEDGFDLGACNPAGKMNFSAPMQSSSDCEENVLVNYSLVPPGVLTSSEAGPSYLTHWFEDQRTPDSSPSSTYQLKDTWGNLLKFPIGSFSKIESPGPDGNVSPHDDIVYTLNFDPIRFQDRQYRVNVINSMLGLYNKKILNPNSPASDSDGDGVEDFLDLPLYDAGAPNLLEDVLPLAGLLNNDPYWGQIDGMITGENFLTVRFEY